MATKTRELRLSISAVDKSGTKSLRELGGAGEKMGKDIEGGAERAEKALKDLESKGSGLSVSLKESGDEAGGMFSDAFSTALGLGMENAAGIAMEAFGQMLEGDAAKDMLAAQLGGSEWAQDMGEVAGDLYTQGFGDSITDTADTLRDVMRGGLLPEDATNEQIESMTAQLMTFSDVMGQDVAMSTNAVSNMLRNGLARDGSAALDILTRGIQQGGDKAGDLAETFNEYSTQFRELGLNGAQAMGLMVQGVKGGARDADIVADAMKEFAIRAQDGSETTADAFEALGLKGEEMAQKIAGGGPEAAAALDMTLDRLRAIEDPALRAQVAVGLFGTQSEDLQNALGSLDLTTAEKSLGNVAGATDKLGTAYDNAQSKLETFRRQALAKVQQFIADKVLPALGDVVNWAKENPTQFKMVAAVIGTVLVAAFVAWAIAAAQAAIATLAATWPILAIIAVIALLVAGVIWAIQNWDLLKDAFGAVASWVTETVLPAIRDFGNWLAENFVEAVKKAGRVLLFFATGGMSEVVFWVIRHWDSIVAFITGIPGKLRAVASHLWNFVYEKAASAVDSAKLFIAGVIEWIKGLPLRIYYAAQGMWNGIVDAFKGAINTIIDLWNGISFPSLTIGGSDPLGDFGPALPKVTIGGWDLPNIPRLEAGAVVRATPGGILANIGEGRFDEAVVPLTDDTLGGGDTYVTIDMRGAVVGSEAQFRRMVGDAWNDLARTGKVNVNGRRVTA